VEWVNKEIKQDHRFMGEPRLEMDQAWHELLAGTMIRFSAEEMHMANNATSARHVDGTGYIGGLGVSHNLHCLVSLLRLLPIDLHAVFVPNERTMAEENQAVHVP
jgi:hypothetical protein